MEALVSKLLQRATKRLVRKRRVPTLPCSISVLTASQKYIAARIKHEMPDLTYYQHHVLESSWADTPIHNKDGADFALGELLLVPMKIL